MGAAGLFTGLATLTNLAAEAISADRQRQSAQILADADKAYQDWRSQLAALPEIEAADDAAADQAAAALPPEKPTTSPQGVHP